MDKDWKQIAADTYHFIFHGDSLASLAAFFVVAYVSLKFIIFPLIGWVLSTPLPMVAVISSSMHHGDDWLQTQADCGYRCTQQEYYASHNISPTRFETFRFDDGLSIGDIMLVRGKSDYEQGDVIVYEPRQASVCRSSTPIIHRVVERQDNGTYLVKGDNNAAPIDCQGEQSLNENRILGAAYARVPWAGWLKIAVTNPGTVLQGGI